MLVLQRRESPSGLGGPGSQRSGGLAPVSHHSCCLKTPLGMEEEQQDQNTSQFLCASPRTLKNTQNDFKNTMKETMCMQCVCMDCVYAMCL